VVALLGDFDVKILAIETGDKFVGSGKLKRCPNILPYARCSGGRQCQTNGFRKTLAYLNDLTILGTEVMSPLGDAVCFIYGDAINLDRIKQRKDAWCKQR